MVVKFNKNNNCHVLFHVLRYYTGLPNRGRDGEQKTMPVNGVTRFRVSRQAVMAAIKERLQESLCENYEADAFGFRTKDLKGKLVELGGEYIPNTQELNAVATSVSLGIRSKENKNGSEDTQTILWHKKEIHALLTKIKKLKEEKPVTYEKLLNPAAIQQELFHQAMNEHSWEEEHREKLESGFKGMLKSKKKELASFLKTVSADSIDDWKEENYKKLVSEIAKTYEENRELFDAIIKATKKDTKDEVEVIKEILEKNLKIAYVPSILATLCGRFSTTPMLENVHNCFYNLGAVGVSEFYHTQEYMTCIGEEKNQASFIGDTAGPAMSLAYEYYCLNVKQFYDVRGDEAFGSLDAAIKSLIPAVYKMQPIGGRRHGYNAHAPKVMVVEVRNDNFPQNHLDCFGDPVIPDNVNEIDLRAANNLFKQMEWCNHNNLGEVKRFVVVGDPRIQNLVPSNFLQTNMKEVAEKCLEVVKMFPVK